MKWVIGIGTGLIVLWLGYKWYMKKYPKPTGDPSNGTQPPSGTQNALPVEHNTTTPIVPPGSTTAVIQVQPAPKGTLVTADNLAGLGGVSGVGAMGGV